MGALPQRDADLAHLFHRYTAAAQGPAKAAALRELNVEVSRRAEVDAGVRAAVGHLLARTNALALLAARYSGQLPAEHAALLSAAASADAPASGGGLVELLVGEELPRPAGAALVDDWDCLRGMVDAWSAACGPLDQYGMRHSRVFANLCNAGVQPATLGAAAAQHCSGAGAAPLLLGPDAHVAAA